MIMVGSNYSLKSSKSRLKFCFAVTFITVVKQKRKKEA